MATGKQSRSQEAATNRTSLAHLVPSRPGAPEINWGDMHWVHSRPKQRHVVGVNTHTFLCSVVIWARTRLLCVGWPADSEFHLVSHIQIKTRMSTQKVIIRVEVLKSSAQTPKTTIPAPTQLETIFTMIEVKSVFVLSGWFCEESQPILMLALFRNGSLN
jgi:hypothetical protein